VTAFIFHLIPHTHWDREWFLPRAAFHARLIAMFDDLLERMAADPGFRTFLLDGQTVLVEDYLRARPERESELKTLVKSGRLQVGPWYVLADEQIPSGESLIRNLLLGAVDAERLGGGGTGGAARSDVLYSPDAFGHPAVLPTLAREFGIKYGVVWRGLGGEPGQEHDFYRWRGTDGREILLWHLPPDGYEIGAGLPAAGARLPDVWTRVRGVLVKRAAGKHVPLFIGADHHAPHPTLARLRDLLAELEPGSAFRVSRLDEFFQAAEGTTARAVSGELRWSYGYTWTLQGVHGTRAPLKRRHGQVELWLERIAEPLVALARLSAGSGSTMRDRRPVLDTAWRALVRTQFHDTIAGTTADSVAVAAEQRLNDVAAYAGELTRGALHDLAGYDPDTARERAEGTVPALVLWNPAARPRGGVTIADISVFRRDVLVGPPTEGRLPRHGPGYRPLALYGADGRPIPVQVLAHRVTQERADAARHYPDQDEVDQVRVAFRAPVVSGLGVTTLKAGPPAPLASVAPTEEARVRGRTLENRFVAVALEPNGSLTMTDRGKKERYVELLRLEDSGDAGDAYSFAPPARNRMKQSRGPITVRRLAAGPLVAALEARWEATRGIDARMVVQLHAASPIARVTLEIDNRNSHHRLRARIPTELVGLSAIAGAGFATVERAPVQAARAYPRETPVRTAPAHRFVAAARGSRGLAVLAPAFFEYEWTVKGDLLVTLLRAIGDLSRGDLPTRPGHAGWPTAIPAAHCIGKTRIDLALVPMTAQDLERGHVLPELWEDAFLPLHGVWLRDAAALAPAPTTIALEGSGLVFSALKPAQIGSPAALRCYNATGRKVSGAWRFGHGVKTAHRVRADEREAVALVLEQRGNVVRFVAEPHEIVTILVT
jgi:alpha-mannosidase